MAALDEAILAEVAYLLEPLDLAVDSPAERRRLLRALGLDFDVIAAVDLGPLAAAFSQLTALIDELTETPGAITLGDVTSTLQSATQAFSSLRQVFAGLSAASLPPDLAAQLPTLGERLLDYLLVTWLRARHPLACAVLDALGGFDWSVASTTAVVTAQGVAYTPTPVPALNLERLFQLAHDPVNTLKAFYLDGSTSGQPAVDALAMRLWPRLAAIGNALEWPVSVGMNPTLLQALGGQLGTVGTQLGNATLMVPLAIGPDGDVVMLALTLLPGQATGERSMLLVGLSGEAHQTFSGERWNVEVAVAGTLQGVGIDSAGTIILPAASPTTDNVSLTLTVARVPDPDLPLARIGGSTGTRLEIGTVSASVEVEFAGSKPAGAQIEVTAGDVLLVVDFADGDGFVSYLAEHLLGGPLRASVDVTVGWSRARGVYLRAGGSASANGAGRLRSRLPVNLTLGPVTVPAVIVSVDPSGTDLSLALGLEATVALGPVLATVVGLGMRLTASAPSGGGNLGPLDLQLAIQPPEGVALSIQAPGASGTGFLQSGPNPGEYLGAIDLRFGQVEVQGVGVLSTNIPGGPAFSLVVLVSAEFPRIDLGFGFALVGIGGLVGLNRTMDVPRLQQLARGGGLDQLMFPADLAHNAPRVANDLGTYFPPADGQFVLGPTARIVWGESGFLTAELAILIELPEPLRIALLGTIHLTLPQAEAAVIDVTLDLLGVLDLSAGTLSLDAGLRKSTIGGFTLSGQAALRARFGNNPSFMLAVGGFNPHFTPPSGFPKLQRVMLSAGTDNPRLRLAAYFALTSNTLQFGARAELYASAGPASVSATLSFDALVQYKPLLLVVDLSISAVVALSGTPVLAVRVDLHITGPDPWHILGQAQFQVLFWSFTVPIDLTVGPSAPLQASTSVDVLGKLADALRDLHNWQLSPPSGPSLVTLRPADPSASLAVHPLGQLSVRQRVVPLQVTVDRFGPDPLPGTSVLDVANPRLNSVTLANGATRPVMDYFAPAQFVTMSDADKLGAPSYEQLDAGLAIAPVSASVPVDNGVATVVASTRLWTTLTVDAPDAPTGFTAGVTRARTLSLLADSRSQPSPDLVQQQLGGAAAAVNGAISRGAAAYAGRSSGVEVTAPSYAAARVDVIQTMSPVRLGNQPLSNLASRTQTADLLDRVASTGSPVQIVFSSELPGSLAAVGPGQ